MTLVRGAGRGLRRVRARALSARRLVPGIFVCVVVAVAAQFLSEHYGAPAMLMALLMGMALHFLSEEGRCPPGVEVAAKTILRLGVALLGARVSVNLVAELGTRVVVGLVLAVVLTLGFGVLVARLLGRSWRFGLLTGGSVAICGASAAIALSAVLPKNEHSERNLIFTVLSVTVLSTCAMIAYPILAHTFGLDDVSSGIFLGSTIHDVAQVVGAGFSVSDEAGEVATLVKLIRVTMLAPIVLVVSLMVRNRALQHGQAGQKPPIVPFFVLAFIGLAAMNSLDILPASAAETMNFISRWALLTSIAAVGIKSSLKQMLEVGHQAIVLVVAETLFIAVLTLVGMSVFL